MVCGVQCVTMAGPEMMPPQFADNWGTIIMVCKVLLNCIISYQKQIV